ncbi:transketolase [Ancylobacter novellus DSM 506]|uniref:Transketolase n=1 Tax=Ancylobacter novellus (strain ATCC 8093 / DSM 506 / JCM 20403 / CCM 1077 / IAM 12100 / NBRC 12443 / NCIMB 10456) TaxID=639283 RepID=D7A341_ANCN5|nr:transketolase [Ancylobacter novellus DSM 506]
MLTRNAPTSQRPPQDLPEVLHDDMANALRALAMDAVEQAKSGHPGMPMGMADVATALFSRFVKIDPTRPDWYDRDRVVLSAGHGSMLLYAVNHLLGYADMGTDQLRRFRQLGAVTAGHPEHGHTLGVETTTGPLGQGLATAVGMALAERMLNARFGDDLVDHYTYVIAGDGCLMEGISHEAIDLAGHLKLGKLILLWDDNGISIDGRTTLSTSTDQLARFEAAGWDVMRVDGHAYHAVTDAIAEARGTERPTLIACRTTIGFGAPTKAGTEGAHGAPLGPDEIAGARARLGWSHPPFEVPDDVREAWAHTAARGRTAREAWERRLSGSGRRAAFEAAMEGELPADFDEKLDAYKRELSQSAPKVATRKASEMALGVINAETELTVGGSADLTHSNLTYTKGLMPVTPGNFAGRYLHYGIREHAMAAVMNGLALHRGTIPYGGTFLVFSDYARGAMRLSALMGQRVVYVLTHDSIGLGEDGPTHQPVEHLAMLRATPNLHVFRPADAVETLEAWQLALHAERTPSVLALSRQNLPTFRTTHSEENLTGYGAYVARKPERRRDVTLLATGSEVELAFKAADMLALRGVDAAVVSMPCWELFEKQSADYRRAVLGTAPRVAVEAAARFGWDRWIGERGRFVGMEGFGASAPAADLYRYFNITPEAVVAAACDLITCA